MPYVTPKYRPVDSAPGGSSNSSAPVFGDILGSRTTGRVPAVEMPLASVISFCALIHISGMSIIPLAAVVSAPFLPIMGRAAPVRRLIAWLSALVISGLYLAFSISKDFGKMGSMDVGAQTLLWPAGGLITAVAVAWSVRVIGLERVLLYVGSGAVVSTFIDPSDSGNWWKFGGSTGVTILLLLLAEKIGKPAVAIALGLLTVANIFFDFRSLAIICFLVFGLALLINPIGRIAAQGRIATAVVGAGLAVAVSAVFSAAISSGLAGQAMLERAAYQTSLGQNAVLGGRTEWGATLDLMHASPWGFGAGTAPADGVMQSAIEAAGKLGGDTASPYFYTEVFGARVDLHSSLGDLWYHFGATGLVSALAILWVLFGCVFRLLRFRPRFWVTLQVLFLLAAWDLFFSPMPDSAKISVALGLCFAVVRVLPVGELQEVRRSALAYPALSVLASRARNVREGAAHMKTLLIEKAPGSWIPALHSSWRADVAR